MKHNWSFIQRLSKQGEPKKALLEKAFDEYLSYREERALARQHCRSIWSYRDISLSESYRYRVRDQKYGETWCEYRLLPPMRPEDIEEVKEDEWCFINSPYDCTGRAFTQGIHPHINPSGWVSWIHYKGLDV